MADSKDGEKEEKENKETNARQAHDGYKNENSLEKLQIITEEYLNGWKRAKADYQNLKKETERKQKEAVDFALAAHMIKLLPVNENLRQALDHLPEEIKESQWAKGLTYIKKQLEDVFSDIGLNRVPALGEQFDPNIHEAVSHEAREGVDAGRIFEEVQEGYTLHGVTLVPAKVKVAK